jgi:hypothetical protein
VSHPVEAGVDASLDVGTDAHDIARDNAPDVDLDVPTDTLTDAPPADATSSGSCNLSARALCEDFVNVHAGPYMAACMSMSGTWSSDACTHTAALGGCQHNRSDGSHTVLWFYDTDADVAMTRTQCESSMGTWVVP